MSGIPSRGSAPSSSPHAAGWSAQLTDWWTAYVAGLTLMGLVVAVLVALAVLCCGALLIFALLAVTGALKWVFMIALVGAPIGIWLHRNHQPDVPLQPLREVSRPIDSPFGDAGYAYFEEIERCGLIPRSTDAWFGAIWLGRPINVEWQAGLDLPIENTYLRYGGENNIVTFSSAGGGKNAAAIIPTLLINPQSMFVVDPKGENWFTTHRTRAELHGHRIIAINPFNLYGRELGFAAPMTHHFNPLGHLRPDQPDFVANINTVGAALIVADGDKRHWTDRARQVCTGVMAQLCSDPGHLARGDNNLPMLRRLLGLPNLEFAAWCKRAAASSSLPVVRDNLAAFSADTDEVKDVIATACGQLDFLTEPALIEFLSRSDFDFADLRRARVTIYCMIPPALMDTYARFVRVLVQSCFNALSASPITERAPVLMVLDEQAKLGSMDIIKTSAATLRGYKVRIWSVFQDINQLKSLYPDAWETFLANAGITQVMTVNDAATAQYFSDKIGKRGVAVQSTSRSQNFNSNPNGPGSSGTGTSTTVNEQALPFFTPQTFYNRSNAYGLVLVQGLAYPISVERLGYHERRDWYGKPNYFQPWPDAGLPAIELGACGPLPYTPNPEHTPDILARERERLAPLQVVPLKQPVALLPAPRRAA